MDTSHTQRRLATQVAIITGSTRGIGEAIARRFGAEGAEVVITGRAKADGKAVAESITDAGGTAVFVGADMRSPNEIAALFEATVEEFGTVDVLVNNSAVQTETAAGEATIDDWELVVETDF